MAWVETVPLDRASGELAVQYGKIACGGVAGVHQAQSLNPRAMAAHFELYRSIVFQPSSLSHAQREALAVIVSRANRCSYCEAHHSEALARSSNEESAPHPALVEWAERLARLPERSSKADIDRLRQIGLDDRAILDAVLDRCVFQLLRQPHRAGTRGAARRRLSGDMPA